MNSSSLTLEELSFFDFQQKISNLSDKDLNHPIQHGNIASLKELAKASNPGSFFVAKYNKGDEVVSCGSISELQIANHVDLSYAFVPLGLILKGDVMVNKGGKGVKKLSQGDFLGLFETADFLITGKRREIGNWTLFADNDVEIVYFKKDLFCNSDPAIDIFRHYIIDLAKSDHVPQPVTTLPLLDWLASHTTKARQANCAVIIHTHLLPNNLPLFRHLAYLLDSGHVYILDKPYSTVKKTYNDLVWAGFEVVPVRMENDLPYEFATDKSLDVLWRRLIEDQRKRKFTKLLIIDDGGEVWRSIPHEQLAGVNIAVVEQTQRGIARLNGSSLNHPPIVSVASAGIKKIIESEFIGLSVVKKLQELNAFNDIKRVGIIGMGSIGLSVDGALKKLGIATISYDPDPKNNSNSDSSRQSLDSLINDSDMLIGTTGTDALKGLPFNRITTGKKIFVSASSADIEFGSLLKIAEKHDDPFGTVSIHVHDNFTIDVLNGGYPINFDRQKDSTPDEDIVLTRCLMYIGAMQAVELINQGYTKQTIFNLDKIAQAKLLDKWIDYKQELDQAISIGKDDIEKIVNFTSMDGEEMATVWVD